MPGLLTVCVQLQLNFSLNVTEVWVRVVTVIYSPGVVMWMYVVLTYATLLGSIASC